MPPAAPGATAHLAARGHEVVGVDRSAAMLAKARARLPQSTFEEGDLEALPLADASVDAAVCALALVHLRAVGNAVAELARVVRAGGRVIISDVHPFLVLLGWQAQFRTAAGGGGFMRLHPHLPSEYCAAFAAAGLRLRGCHEPRLTPEAAATPAAERLPRGQPRRLGGPAGRADLRPGEDLSRPVSRLQRLRGAGRSTPCARRERRAVGSALVCACGRWHMAGEEPA